MHISITHPPTGEKNHTKCLKQKEIDIGNGYKAIHLLDWKGEIVTNRLMMSMLPKLLEHGQGSCCRICTHCLFCRKPGPTLLLMLQKLAHNYLLLLLQLPAPMNIVLLSHHPLLLLMELH